MKTTRRRPRIALLAIALVVLLSGCMRINIDLVLAEDDTASGSAVMAISDETAQQLGYTPEQMWAEMEADLTTDLPEGATVEPYSADGYTGTQFTFAAVPISEFSSADLSLTREGDTFVFSGTMESDDTDLGQMPPGIMDGLDIRYTITFPGAVSEQTGGELQGSNTVTWQVVPGETLTMHAVGSAIPDGNAGDGALGGLAWWIWVIIGVVALALIAAIIFLVRGKKKAQDDQAALQGGSPQYGQVPEGYAQPGYPQQGQAPQGYPQPGYPQAGQQGYAPDGQHGQVPPGYPQPDHAGYSGHAQQGQPPQAQAPQGSQPGDPQAGQQPAEPGQPGEQSPNDAEPGRPGQS